SHIIKRNFFVAPINGTMPAIDLYPNPLQNPVNRFFKRAFDIFFSAGVILTFGLPILIPVAIAIKLSSPGPVFFKQKRTGYRGRDFNCYKFRTMKINNESDSRAATKDDERKTRVGDFLRRTSIDELPQFWNVLMGDMSVVGPRPHMVSFTKQYRQVIGEYMVRLLIKPGITGWAQANGYRGNTDKLWKMEKRVESDIWYIENWSFRLDLKIILMTVIDIIKGDENAY
ncbi:MAG: exopolysaccharide biosynthesis polyprenyl glycosylphosphotransferase, partial [Muribaculaceae bacterium]|nr:exopolysaccharide biosynthesis polyprenyl glycosylphosphotransferase [Muribaculaceae bacterium]